jgi:hypothetical protein
MILNPASTVSRLAATARQLGPETEILSISWRDQAAWLRLGAATVQP